MKHRTKTGILSAQCHLYKDRNNVKVEKITSKRKKMYIKIKTKTRQFNSKMTALISKLKKYEAVKFINWRIAVNGNSIIM